MAKRVYSLLLSEEVVEAIDRIAYQENVSRSYLIDRVLGEFSNCLTPEQKKRQTLERVQMLMGDRFQMQPQTGMLSMHRMLQFKYRPTLRYTVELTEGESLGILRISVRTQSASLLLCLQHCFSNIMQLEEPYAGSPQSEMEQGSWTRILRRSDRIRDTETAAMAIGAYVRLIDEVIQLSFRELEHDVSFRQIEEFYISQLKQIPIL